MKHKFLKSLGTAAAIIAVAGFATAAQAGFAPPDPVAPVPFSGASLTVTELGVPIIPGIGGPGLEFIINNPNIGTLADPVGPVGDIFGLMVGITDQRRDAATGNVGWFENQFTTTIFSGGQLANFTGGLETELELADGSLDFLFDGFFDTGGEVILAFFTFEQPSLVLAQPVLPGTSRGGFYGVGSLNLQSDIVLFGTNGTCVGQTGTPCITGTTNVPEPGTLALFGIGVIGIGLAVRRRRQRS